MLWNKALVAKPDCVTMRSRNLWFFLSRTALPLVQVACLFLPFRHRFWLGLSVMSLKYPGYWWSEPPRWNQSGFSTRIFFNWNWWGGSYFLVGSIITRRQVSEFREKSQSSSFLLLASHRKRDKPTKRSRDKRQNSVSGRIHSKEGEPAQAPRTHTSFLFREPSFGVADRK